MLQTVPMRGIWNRLFGNGCDHESTLVATSVGVTRAVCQRCGHISFEMRQASAFEWAANETELQAELPKVVGL